MTRDYKRDGVISYPYGTDTGRFCKAEFGICKNEKLNIMVNVDDVIEENSA